MKRRASERSAPRSPQSVRKARQARLTRTQARREALQRKAAPPEPPAQRRSPRGYTGGAVAGAAEPRAAAARRQLSGAGAGERPDSGDELRAMKLGALVRRAMAEGVDGGQLDAAEERAAPKAAIIALLLGHRAAAAQQAEDAQEEERLQVLADLTQQLARPAEDAARMLRFLLLSLLHPFLK